MTSRPAGHALRRRAHWRKEQGAADASSKIHKQKNTKIMKDNQQRHLKGPSDSLHHTTQRTHARLFLERGTASLPSFPKPSGEYQFEFEFVRVRCPHGKRRERGNCRTLEFYTLVESEPAKLKFSPHSPPYFFSNLRGSILKTKKNKNRVTWLNQFLI